MISVSPDPLWNLEQVTTDWLVRVLGQAQYPFSHFISGVVVEKLGGRWSSCARLLLNYKPGSDTAELPASLFLKVAGGPESEFGDSEVRYYSCIGAQISNPPLPHCYHAACSLKSGYYHLLLQDLSASHRASWEKVWTEAEASQLAQAFAALHAAWWNHPDLAAQVAPRPDEAVLARYLFPAQQGLVPLIEAVRERLPQQQSEVIRRVFEQHPQLMRQRAESKHHMTCIHGDPNPGNILCPASPQGRCFLIDRQPFRWSLQTWLGASDLAYAMVHWWPPEQRAALEVPLLQHYHQALMALGVEGYPWQALWYDYRLCVMQSFYVVSEWCRDPQQKIDFEWVWWPQLQRTLRAFADLECQDFLA